jgi:hypothetical protein
MRSLSARASAHCFARCALDADGVRPQRKAREGVARGGLGYQGPLTSIASSLRVSRHSGRRRSAVVRVAFRQVLLKLDSLGHRSASSDAPGDIVIP